MCFQNQGNRLEEIRAGKRSILVWKTGSVHPRTGRVVTQRGTHKVEWIKGQTVHPHQIRKPLRDGAICSAGLYFNTGEPPTGRSGLVIARVKPEDIIGVDLHGNQICCVTAKVVEAPNPDPRLMRMKFLRQSAAQARVQHSYRLSIIKEWAGEEDKNQEALRAIKDELKELQKPKVRSRKSAKK